MQGLRALAVASALCACWPAYAADITQETWDIIEALAIKLAKPPLSPLKVVDIRDVELTRIELASNGELRREGGQIEIPRIETITVDNYSCQDFPWKRSIKTMIKSVITVTMKKTVATTKTTTVDAGASLFGLVETKVKYTKEDKIIVSDKDDQIFTTENMVLKNEDYKVPPRSRLIYRSQVHDTTTTYRFTGLGVVNAAIIYPRVGAPMFTDSALLNGPNFSPPPGPRTIDLEGVLVTEETSDVRVDYKVSPLETTAPPCVTQ